MAYHRILNIVPCAIQSELVYQGNFFLYRTFTFLCDHIDHSSPLSYVFSIIFRKAFPLLIHTYIYGCICVCIHVCVYIYV